jgi:tellurite resistance protein TerC
MEPWLWLWIVFGALVAGILILDLGVLSRSARAWTLGRAARWSACVVAVALSFGLVVWWGAGSRRALEYYTGYLIELSLSVDNLLVFIMIFQYFGVPPELRPRVLKWGILGAMVMRGTMIAAGVVALSRFEWVIYVFGAVLVITGIRMMRAQEEHFEPERNPVVRLFRRFLPLTPGYAGTAFVVRTARGLSGTPLLLVLLVVDWFDLVFAIDSIPAVFAITREPLIVYSSNVFAILGLWAMFFVLAGMIDRFRYLKPAVALILVLVGAKMLVHAWGIEVPVGAFLGVVVVLLGLGVGLSWRSRLK